MPAKTWAYHRTRSNVIENKTKHTSERRKCVVGLQATTQNELNTMFSTMCSLNRAPQRSGSSARTRSKPNVLSTCMTTERTQAHAAIMNPQFARTQQTRTFSRCSHAIWMAGLTRMRRLNLRPYAQIELMLDLLTPFNGRC